MLKWPCYTGGHLGFGASIQNFTGQQNLLKIHSKTNIQAQYQSSKSLFDDTFVLIYLFSKILKMENFPQRAITHDCMSQFAPFFLCA